MWETNTIWLDLAAFLFLMLIGHILLGQLLCFIVPVAVGGVIVHGWWLPKHGVNGWTGEPRQKYLELVGARKGPAA